MNVKFNMCRLHNNATLVIGQYTFHKARQSHLIHYPLCHVSDWGICHHQIRVIKLIHASQDMRRLLRKMGCSEGFRKTHKYSPRSNVIVHSSGTQKKNGPSYNVVQISRNIQTQFKTESIVIEH